MPLPIAPISAAQDKGLFSLSPHQAFCAAFELPRSIPTSSADLSLEAADFIGLLMASRASFQEVRAMRFKVALGWLALLLATNLVASNGVAACSGTRASPHIAVDIARTTARAGEPVSIRWSNTAKDVASCRAPMFLVLATSARVRFSGSGFLAMSPDTNGPYGIEEAKAKTRIFVPLHAGSSVASGQFEIKFYSVGQQSIDWFVITVPSNGERGTPSVLTRATSALAIVIESGRPIIVVRDSLNP